MAYFCPRRKDALFLENQFISNGLRHDQIVDVKVGRKKKKGLLAVTKCQRERESMRKGKIERGQREQCMQKERERFRKRCSDRDRGIEVLRERERGVKIANERKEHTEREREHSGERERERGADIVF